MRRVLTICAVAAVILTAGGVARAAWSDNFNGNTAQQMWTTIGSGSAVVQNDRYEIGTSYDESDQAIISYVCTESDDADYVMQARVQQISENDNYLAYLAGRLTPGNGNGYVCGISSGGHLWLGKLAGGAYQSLASLTEQPSFDFTDCQIKFSLNGTSLKGKVWSTGSSEPGSWQIETTDSDYASGYGGVMVGTYHTLGWDTVSVAFDDVSLVPEPATICLLGLGGLAMFGRRKSA